jgi:LysR family hydrogen peroxide-inducible transcriptional activator
VVLVERTKRNVRFTPLGNAVVAKAHRILREAEELSDLIHEQPAPFGRDADERDPHHRALPAAPHAAPVAARAPALKLFLREEPSAQAIESLHHGRADCVLLALPFATGEVEKETIELDALFVAFPKDDPRDPPAEISPDLIEENRLLLLEDGHCLKEHALAACNPPELRASATMIGTSLHTLVQMVDNGLGLTMLPEMALDAGILNGTNVVAAR